MFIDAQHIHTMLTEVGHAILHYYRMPMEIIHKTDRSPVTKADKVANDLLVKGLQALTPGCPILSEESPIAPFLERKTWQQYWVVDPLDGTQDFLAQTDEFCVCLAFIEKGTVLFSALHVPLTETTYCAKKGAGVLRLCSTSLPILLYPPTLSEQRRLVLSRLRPSKRLQEFAARHGFELQLCGSALKFVHLIEGRAELFIRLGKSHIWDVVVGVTLLEELGGRLCDLEQGSLDFSPQETLWCPPFIATLHIEAMAVLWPAVLQLKS